MRVHGALDAHPSVRRADIYIGLCIVAANCSISLMCTYAFSPCDCVLAFVFREPCAYANMPCHERAEQCAFDDDDDAPGTKCAVRVFRIYTKIHTQTITYARMIGIE